MKFLLSLFALVLLCSSCFTSSLLNSNEDFSSLPPDAYSFNRAYYSSDSLLHIDFNNLKNTAIGKRYFSVTIDVNNILTEYDKGKMLRNRDYRHYNLMSISNLVCDASCNVNYGNTSLLVFGDVRVHYLSELESIQDSTLLVYTDLLNDQCVLKTNGGRYRYYSEPPVNDPKDVYMLQTLRDPNRFVALRLPLINGQTKLSLLPFTLFLDIITSPIQLGFYVITHKTDQGDEHHKKDKTDVPSNNPHLIHKPH